jgi:hypothetical protein
MKNNSIDWKKGAAEFFIVVVGVMLALAADRWQQGRDEQAMAAEYLERLYVDLSTDLDVYQRVVDSSLEIDRAAQYVIDVYRGRDVSVDEREKFVMYVLAASFAPFLRGTNATYVDLINTGNLGLLPIGTRNLITTYYERKEGLISRLSMFRVAHTEGYWRLPALILGPDVLPDLWSQRAGQLASVIPAPGSLGLDTEYIDAAIARLRSIQNFEQLAGQVRYYMAQRSNINGVRLTNEARQLQEALESARQ